MYSSATQCSQIILFTSLLLSTQFRIFRRPYCTLQQHLHPSSLTNVNSKHQYSRMESKHAGRGRFDGSEDEYDTHASAKASKVTSDSYSQEKVTSHHPSSGVHIAESKIVSGHATAGSKATITHSASSKIIENTGLDAGFKDEKALLDELQADIEADEEFERLKAKQVVPVPEIGRSTLARNFVRGFRIVSMNMRDATTGQLMWRSADWDIAQMFSHEVTEEIPRDILQCRVVSREIVFSSTVEMNNFRLEQRVYFQGVCIEEWRFKFGYVMAGSRNSWQQTIDAAPPSEMLPAEVLSGNIVFETAFFDDKEFLCKNSIRIVYV